MEERISDDFERVVNHADESDVAEIEVCGDGEEDFADIVREQRV